MFGFLKGASSTVSVMFCCQKVVTFDDYIEYDADDDQNDDDFDDDNYAKHSS